MSKFWLRCFRMRGASPFVELDFARTADGHFLVFWVLVFLSSHFGLLSSWMYGTNLF